MSDKPETETAEAEEEGGFPAEEEFSTGREIAGGFVIYAVLFVCAGFSLLPLALTTGLPAAPVPPEPVLYDVRGGEVRLSDYDGMPLVACFWSFDDPSSRRQLAHLAVVRKRYSRDSVGIVTFCMRYGEAEDVAAYVRRIDAPFPVILCSVDVADDLLRSGRSPVITIRSGEGEPVAGFRGLVMPGKIAREVEKLLP